MRTLQLTLLAIAAALAAEPAFAQVYDGPPLAPPAPQDEIVAAVAGRMLDPRAVHVRDLRLSKARGGKGYCGQVSADGKPPFLPFHVIDEDGKPAVLILPASGDPPGLSRADATLLLTNLGCLP